MMGASRHFGQIGDGRLGGWLLKQTDLSPTDLRGIFGANLRELAAREPSVAQLCRNIGINRTQFNRYLNGEAFPRPDVLYRICCHFDVDARVLLEPLWQVERQGKTDAAVLSVARYFGALGSMALEASVLPDGAYRLFRLSYFDDTALSCHMFTSRRDAAGVVRMRGYMSGEASLRLGLPKANADRRLLGVVFRQMNGFSFVLALRQIPLMFLGGFEPNYLGHPQFYSGSLISSHDVSSPTPILIERLEPTLAAMLAARHSIGVHPRETYSPLVQGYFSRCQTRSVVAT
nr:helix-turn-helix transcriptional regulator [uncultured Celeribacter sp.]